MAWTRNDNVVGFDASWQRPAITEEHAYRKLVDGRAQLARSVVYVGFPWAALIDGLNRRTELGDRLEKELCKGPTESIASYSHVITVCQHIKFRDFIHLFRKMGITDVFASHAEADETDIKGVAIHPFPLFPVVRLSGAACSRRFDALDFRARSYLYSFVGAYEPRFYLSRTREWIFGLPRTSRSYVRGRAQWHYEKSVYREQVYGQARCASDIGHQEQAEREYLSVLRDSKFSLCPSGTGPNSIRLWESIESGCIPVVLADRLALPGNRELWEDACVFVEETVDAVHEVPARLAAIERDEALVTQKLSALKVLRDRYGVASFVSSIFEFADGVDKLSDTSRFPARLTLELRRLSVAGQLSWVIYACAVAKHALHDKCCVLIARSTLHPVVRDYCESNWFRRCHPFVSLTPANLFPSPNEEFVFVTGSEALKAQLLLLNGRIHVEPSGAIGAVDPRFYWNPFVGECYELLLRKASEAVRATWQGSLLHLARRLRPSAKRVSLITSVFKGDEYIAAFLDNIGQLHDYHDCEHFLIRPGSPGSEHSALIEHARHSASAIYINWIADPGLYEVWNTGARLSGAKYLSNANLDDRRAPTHTARLAEILDRDDSVQVASSALRITEVKNQPWSEAEGAPVWYGRDASGEQYEGRKLVRATGAGLASCNMPHCMPLWRRQLHAFNGFFSEKLYGPSSDWEFWLRVGAKGAKFYLLGEPLGLYLIDQGSYWRREGSTGDATNDFDSAILAGYGGWASGDGAAFEEGPPVALLARDALTALRQGAYLEFVIGLLRSAGRSHDGGNAEADTLVSAIADRHLAGIDLRAIDFPALSRAVESGVDLDGVLDRLIEAIRNHCFDAASKSQRLAILTTFLGFFTDVYSATGKLRPIFALALLYRKLGMLDAEQYVWERLHSHCGTEFWEEFQRVYRFVVPLANVAGGLGLVHVPESEPRANKARTQVWFFPDYTAGNAYQERLYSELRGKGGVAHGLADIEQLLSIAPQQDSDNILHIHWINAALKGATKVTFSKHAQRLLDVVAEVKARGFSVYWTIHNRLNHESVDEEGEIALRRSLYRLTDRVYVHHPLALSSMEWIPNDKMPWLCEHGNYIRDQRVQHSRVAAKAKAGFSEDDFVVVHVGQVRSYKGLDRYLPILSDLMKSDPRLKLVIAGKVVCSNVKAMLRDLDSDQVSVRDMFVPEEDLELIVRASDLAFLSYRSIVTSGSLFHMFSLGTPVLAPRLGTIPAYVVDDWNGYLYSSATDIEHVLRRLLMAGRYKVATLGMNAYKTASKLAWQFP